MRILESFVTLIWAVCRHNLVCLSISTSVGLAESHAFRAIVSQGLKLILERVKNLVNELQR